MVCHYIENSKWLPTEDQELGSKWWSNESAVIEGYLSTNYLTPNQRKDDLDRTTRFYKEVNKALRASNEGCGQISRFTARWLQMVKDSQALAMAQDDFEMGKIPCIRVVWNILMHTH